MGRGVSYLNNAECIWYLNYEQDEEYDDFDGSDWEDYQEFIQETIQEKYPSFEVVHKWDNNETLIILENKYAAIGISEYCSIVSISIATISSDYVNENLAIHWINQISSNLGDLITKTFPTTALNRIGGFSNGESIFELAKK